jgi:hypothetical protein
MLRTSTIIWRERILDVQSKRERNTRDAVLSSTRVVNIIIDVGI